MTAAGYYQSDRSVIGRIRNREAAAAYRESFARTVTPDFVGRLEAIQLAYPHLDAGVMIGLAKSNLDITSEAVQQIAEVAHEKKAQEGAFDSLGGFLNNAKKIGAPFGALGRVADTALGGIDEAIIPVGKGAIRTGFVVLESAGQELATFIRAAGWAGVRAKEGHGSFLDNFTQHYNDAGTSLLREAISDIGSDEGIDLGSGFFGVGKIREEQKERAGRLSLSIGGHRFGGPGNQAITPGRVVAASVVEPGTQPFNVVSGLIDGGVAWFGDPAAAVAGAARTARVGARVGRAQRAFRDVEAADDLFGATRRAVTALGTDPGFTKVVDRSYQSRAAETVAGLIPGHRNTLLPVATDEWLTKGARPLAQKIAATGDFYDLWQATNKKMGVDLTRRLADAGTEQEVMDILRGAVGTQLREAPEFLGFKVRRADAGPGNVRLLQSMPGSFIDPNNLDQGVEQLDRWLRNAKVSAKTRRSAVDRYARTVDRTEQVTTLSDIMEETAGEIAERLLSRRIGSPRSRAIADMRAKEMTRMWNQTIERTRAYFVDEIAENRRAAGIVVDDDVLPVQSPFLITEYLDSLIPLPDAREIRRATSTLGRLVDNPLFETTTGALDALQGQWKRVALLRGAYTVRVIGEEQVRIAASGMDSMFSHPISFIAALMGNGKATKKWVSGSVRQMDVTGTSFDEAVEFANSLNKGWAGWIDGTLYDRHYSVFRPEDDQFRTAWGQGVFKLHNDPLAREVAAGRGNLDDVKRWFYEEQGRGLRKRMIADQPDLATRAGSDRYIDTLWEGIQYRTGSDPTLLDAVATGKINGATLGKMNDQGVVKVTDDLLAHMDTLTPPEAVIGLKIQRHGGDSQAKAIWDNATGAMFSVLNTKPTNYLSRSPTFRAKYWQRIEEMLPHMDDATRAKALANAEGVVDAAALKRMRHAGEATERTVTDLDDADMLAKVYGLDETKKLLYDLSEKSQFFDAFRLIFPFGEAWKEVVTRWAKIGAENPRALVRGQQLIQGARGNGFFHKDVNGEEVFTYPLSRSISKWAIGMPIDLNARVSGLSLMTEVLPGVGPVVQLPAAVLVPKEPEWAWFQKIVAPYGSPDTSGGFLEAFAPGYFRNFMQWWSNGEANKRTYMTAVGNAVDYLMSTGDYDLSREEDRFRLDEDARDLAGKVYMLRGMTQFFAPSSPMPEWLVKDVNDADPNDDLLVQREVIKDFRRMEAEDYDGAVGEFIDRYGLDLFLMVQGKTRSIPRKLPVNAAASEWELRNGDLVKKYPEVWGFFAPASEDPADFDYQAYERQFDRGDRESLTTEQRIALAQQRIGRHIYDVAKAKIGDDPTTIERQWLAAIRERIREEYPGYGQQTPGIRERSTTQQIVDELARAITEPKLADTEVGKAARLYLTARNRALAVAQSEYGVKTLDNEASAPLHAWLIRVADAIKARYPGFEEMFDVVFSREVGL